MNIKSEGLTFFEKKIKDALHLDVSKLDFATLPDGVVAITDFGESYMLTNNPLYMDWFKAYERLKYGEVS